MTDSNPSVEPDSDDALTEAHARIRQLDSEVRALKEAYTNATQASILNFVRSTYFHLVPEEWGFKLQLAIQDPLLIKIIAEAYRNDERCSKGVRNVLPQFIEKAEEALKERSS